MTLRAPLKHVVGSKDHVSVMVGRVSGVAPSPDPVALRIIPDGDGVALLRIDKSGTSITHTWHPSIAEAKDRAANEYGVAADEWTDE